MASIAGSLFGFSSSSKPSPPGKMASDVPKAATIPEDGANNSPHFHFIHSMLLPSTVKIQKELRGRKFKDVQAKLGEAVMGMHAFQFESWSPDSSSAQTEATTNDAANHESQVKETKHLPSSSENGTSSATISEEQTPEQDPDNSPQKLSLGAHLEATRPESTDGSDHEDVTDLESTMGDFKEQPADEDRENLTPFRTASPSNDTATTTASSTLSPIHTHSEQPSTATQSPEDDPLTRQAIHPSIQDALDAYVMIMLHPQKTNKACEQALQCMTQLVLRGYVSGRAGGRDDESGSGAAAREAAAAAASENGKGAPMTDPSLLHQLMVGIQKCSDSNTPSVQSNAISCFKEIMVSPKCAVHEASMLLAIRSMFHIYLVTPSTDIQNAAKQALMDMSTTIIERMETAAALENNSVVSSPTNSTTAMSLYHTDSYYLLRSLVKLSSKTLPGIDDDSRTPTNFLAQQFLTTTTAVDPLALNNKVLSLELTLQVMESAGDTLCRKSEKFLHLVQSQLCVALLKNCMSNHTQVAFLSQRIFLILVYKFKTQLKDEIQVFMTNIFLRVLESENSSYPQKALVLESLRSLCKDPVLLTQLFLNYDCDFDAMNLYKEIVFHLIKISGKSIAAPIYSSTSTKETEEKENELSLVSVEVLVTILQAFLIALGMPPMLAEGQDIHIHDITGHKVRAALNLTNICDSANKTVPSISRRLGRRQQNLDVSHRQSNATELNVEDLERIRQAEQQAAATTPATETSSAATPPSFHESSSDVAGRIVDAFNNKRNLEQTFELGAIKFMQNLKAGLRFFIDNDFVNLNAKNIAVFFIENKDKLDKTQMGEVLGREPDAAFVKTPDLDGEDGGPGFFVRVLHHYATSMDFTGLQFDSAIRLFLAGFRLPGESQKIDRIMEKFAERFTQQNPEIFHKADTAFILAFSVIMLNTDLHNPSIKPERRMTIEGFKRNNGGIGENGADLDPEFLDGIYNRIKASAFSLKEDDAVRDRAAAEAMKSSLFSADKGGLLGFGLVGAPTDEEKKKKKFKKEQDEMMSATEQLLRRRKEKTVATQSLVDDVDPADVVTPMLDVTWGPIIGILSQILECSDDERSIGVCLNGFIYSVRVASHCGMSLARDTFVNSLAKFTLLGSIKEMRYKNIEAIRTLMTIAVADGEYLGESWAPVLQCISQLARMRLSASGLDTDESFLKDANVKSPEKKPAQQPSYFTASTKESLTKETEVMNAKAVLESFGDQLIDQIFSSTVNLSAQSLGEFIGQLVDVSRKEIEGESKTGITGVASQMTGSVHGNDSGPSIFSLQRLVEVADYNMEVRPRLVWTQIWEIMSGFFSSIGCHKNSMVSVFAIDSLKQLSSKFLEKPELSEFNFQRVFLQPFLLIIRNPVTRQEIRELILDCMNQIVETKGHNIQSGWKVIFDMLMVSAHDSVERINILALNILQKMLDEHLDQLCQLAKVDDTATTLSATEQRNRNSNADDFIGMCRSSLAFINWKGTGTARPAGVSMRALCHIAIYADLIAARRILPPASGSQTNDPNAPFYTYEGLSEKETLEMSLWRTMLEGLAGAIRSTICSRTGGVGCIVQRGSVLAFRAILLRHGAQFSTSQLAVILKDTLIPAIHDGAASDQTPVASIVSESPSISSLEFMVGPMPLPPPENDSGLMKFEEVSRSMDAAPERPLGPAELLLEASFTDMRHGGDGDLTQVYKFAKKDMHPTEEEQPFPDSWIATTAPVALGCLTDVATEIAVGREDGFDVLWPPIGDVIIRWCNGEAQASGSSSIDPGWEPGEALVRTGGNEVCRFFHRLAEKLDGLEVDESIAWANECISFFSNMMGASLDLENSLKNSLLVQKDAAHAIAKCPSDDGSDSFRDRKEVEAVVENAEAAERPTTNGISASVQPHKGSRNGEIHSWVKLVPKLKIRCVAAHYFNQALSSVDGDTLQLLLEEGAAKVLFKILSRSRQFAEASAKNEDLAHAFQEAMLSEWGEEDEDMGEDTLVNISRMSRNQGCAMFFLTQAAGSSLATSRLLAPLFDPHRDDLSVQWNREAFAKSRFLELMQDVLSKFVASEAKEGHRIDPNVWRISAESGGKLAVYCTSFANVVVGILKALLSFEQVHFNEHKASFYPLICQLIRVQSEEIRQLVQTILLEKFSPFINASDEPDEHEIPTQDIISLE